jgi:hypothetical protein
MDFAAPPWWVQAIWLLGVVALILGGMRVSRRLLVRAGREEPPRVVSRFLRGSEWVVAVGTVLMIVLLILWLAVF